MGKTQLNSQYLEMIKTHVISHFNLQPKHMNIPNLLLELKLNNHKI